MALTTSTTTTAARPGPLGATSRPFAAWTMASRIRNAIMLVRARPSDSLPRDPRDLAAVAQICGYPPGESSRFSDDYLRLTRHAHNTVARLFWDD